MKVDLVMGLPASGKSTLTKELVTKDPFALVLNRDAEGGRVVDLVPRLDDALKVGRSVILDNTFLTRESRAPFLAKAAEHGVPVHCHWLDASFEDAQVNALHRMWDRYGEIFYTQEDIASHPKAKDDPNIFGLPVMGTHRKRLEGDKKKGVPAGFPDMSEGFASVRRVKFQRKPYRGKNKALILDYDGTLRGDVKKLGGEYHFPVQLDQVQVLPNRTEVIQRWKDQGYLLLGVSTQSGIGKGYVTKKMVQDCFEETNRQLGHDIDVHFCVHAGTPPVCLCRKPQAGIGVHLIRKYNLDPAQCMFVGDLGTDRTFAERCGFQYEHPDTFFRSNS